MRPRVAFFGTPAFAVPSLQSLLEVADVVGVVTQPDRKAGRGLAVNPGAVKQVALSHNLDIVQPIKPSGDVFLSWFRALRLDVAVVTAYGRILSRSVLDTPRLGCVNVHASVLPRWRGAAPVQWAIVHGDQQTGVSLMQMDEGMDTGPVLAVRTTDIAGDETASDLARRLSVLGGEILRDEFARLCAGELTPTPQEEALATKAPLLRKTDGEVVWTRTAQQVHDHIRGMTPWPGAFTTGGGRRLRIHRARVAASDGALGDPGSLLDTGGAALHVACGQGAVALTELQLDGKRRMNAAQFMAGQRWSEGTRLGA